MDIMLTPRVNNFNLQESKKKKWPGNCKLLLSPTLDSCSRYYKKAHLHGQYVENQILDLENFADFSKLAYNIQVLFEKCRVTM